MAPAFSIACRIPGPKWIRQLSISTMSLRRSVGTKHCSTYARNISPVIAPWTTIGAVILSCRKAATNVIVSHVPSGTVPITLMPRGARPLSRVKFVLTAVSSRNTSRAGSSRPCSRIQRRRARATSARCRSVACRLFFERDAMPIKKAPKRAAAGANPLFSQLCNDLLQGQIRLFLQQSQNLRGKLFQRRGASAARLWLGIPALFPPLQPSDRRTRADLETVARLTSGGTRHNSCDHADSQVTGISFRHCSNPQNRRINAQTLAP